MIFSSANNTFNTHAHNTNIISYIANVFIRLKFFKNICLLVLLVLSLDLVKSDMYFLIL